MKTKEEKIKILLEAIQIMSEEIQVLSSSTTPPPEEQSWPTPQFNKYRDQVLDLHQHGYTVTGIARALNASSTSVGSWIARLGLTPNKYKKRGPGSISKKKSLKGTIVKYPMLSAKEQNEKLKEEQNNERSNAELHSVQDGGATNS